ncbi:NAD(P)-dependent oxidoreductase [Chryseotalea sanaruensis]|uniref:dTDP-4-dehydrorhamnose reductase n=1 Tax=Chryseotalea sanaruensis TaxID=2482724 RepID=A0A401UD55_9BACT|nr:NAD(P)-dependent oxidoreductase [Chryseotalea sanaruensis]GCC52782.1 NAD(P)-dependent oxidoreductase [Chryseotalea sanaruensis]
MKILVTGANGLLGQKLARLLDEDPEIELVATARKPLGYALQNGVYAKMDIENKEDIVSAFFEHKPEVVIHAAAMTQVDDCEVQREQCWTANVTSVELLAEACQWYNTHLIYVSTDFIFDGSHGPLDENEKPAPVNYYGESKLAAEKVVQASSLTWSILRTVLVYGVTPDMSRSNIVLWVKNSLEQGKPIKVVNDQWRTPTLAEDLAMGCYLAAKKNAKGIFNISGKDFMSPYDIAIKTAEYFKLDKSLITATDSDTFKQTARRPLTTGFVIEKARKELGYEPRSFEEGLKIMSEQL